MIKIEFDAHQATIKTFLESRIEDSIKSALSWKDRSIDYLNRSTRFYQDPTRFCYSDINHSFLTGLLPRVLSILTKNKLEYELIRTYEDIPVLKTDLPDWLYPHQLKIIDTALKCQRCLIQSGTGSGKTIAAAHLLKHFGKDTKILVTVPSINLLENMANVLEETLEEKIGRIGGGFFGEVERVTVGVINSLSNLVETDPQVFNNIQVLIIDEAHRGASNMYQTVSSACRNASYKIGLTATAFRESGDSIVLEGVLGPIALKVSEKELVKNNIIQKPSYYTIAIEQPELIYNDGRKVTQNGKEFVVYNTPNAKPDRNEVYTKSLVNCTKRNQIIVDLVESFLGSPTRTGPALILVQRVDHGLNLKAMFEARGLDIPFADGKVKGKKRQELLDALRNKTLDALIATSILNEGEDIKPLELLVLAGGGSNEKNTTQQVGRVVRTDKGKKRAIVVDFYDSEKYYLRSNSNIRKRFIEMRYPGSHRSVTVEQMKEVLNE